MNDYQGVAVYAEHRDGKLLPIALEGLGAGRKLADALGQPLAALLPGSGVSGLAAEAIAAGADKVYVVDDPLLKDYQADAHAAALEKAVGQVKPQVLILGQDDAGRDLAPRLAFRLGTAATLDCVELEIDAASKRLLATKPVYGGNALAVFTSVSDPQIVTIRTKAMTPRPGRRAAGRDYQYHGGAGRRRRQNHRPGPRRGRGDGSQDRRRGDRGRRRTGYGQRRGLPATGRVGEASQGRGGGQPSPL